MVAGNPIRPGWVFLAATLLPISVSNGGEHRPV